MTSERRQNVVLREVEKLLDFYEQDVMAQNKVTASTSSRYNQPKLSPPGNQILEPSEAQPATS